MTDKPRLIEFAFPLEQASIDSVHEKNVRHGHISTLHIWPARRPLAACRAALIATLLPDPSVEPKPDGISDADWQHEIRNRRQELCERIGGRVVETIERKKMPNGRIVERKKRETKGGILHWIGTEPSSGGPRRIKEHRETVQNRANELEWFRQEIRKAYGGKAPRVLDPFAGGGAIPLEAMRLGCETTAADINPVAWFILKCTLEYPQRLAGKTLPLPEFILGDEEFMDGFYKAHPHLAGPTKKTRARKGEPKWFDREEGERAPRADLAWHVRAWGKWVHERARRVLAEYYPTYADFEPRNLKNPKPYERQPMRLVPLNRDGIPDVDSLNAEFSMEYLADARNPRWVAKPVVAYLWARTAVCKNCRATMPLLKTRWFSRKDQRRVLLTMDANVEKNGVTYGIQSNVPVKGGNAAQKREHDRRLGEGTMSRAGATCPCCSAIMTMEDLRVEGKARRLGSILTAVVIEGQEGKDYRLPTDYEREAADKTADLIDGIYRDIPFGLPYEPTPNEKALGMRIPKYGFSRWRDLYTDRQLTSLGILLRETRRAASEISKQMHASWAEALSAGLAIGFDRIADRQSTICRWDNGYTKLQGTFTRFALSITWDFCEGNPLSNTTGNYLGNLDWVAEFWEHAARAALSSPDARVQRRSAVVLPEDDKYDLILTDPPYYDAIPYSDLMDFFYIWLRRSTFGLSPTFDREFAEAAAPKWRGDLQDGELIDDSSRHGGSAAASRDAYENGMARAFVSCADALTPDGRLVVVFANKTPEAWETLVSAIIKAGFVVDGSWPIQTEMGNRTRAMSSSALSSSVWLACRKRSPLAPPGWDQAVLKDMREKVSSKLRDYWDSGIKGPDFVWAATGPALESYSQHPIVKKANEPGTTMSVSEFLIHARRIVVDFVVGQVLTGEVAAADQLDSPTSYYLLHRHNFRMEDAPAGACILYATACGLSDRDLEATWDLVTHPGKSSSQSSEPNDDDDDESEPLDDGAEESGGSDSGSKFRLKQWSQRKQKTMGYEAPGGQTVPLVDRIHRLMHLWRVGDVIRVDEYLDDNGLRRQELFRRVLQSLIEVSEGEERSLLEALSNHVQAKGATPESPQKFLPMVIADSEES